jgi:hypothetical protein
MAFAVIAATLIAVMGVAVAPPMTLMDPITTIAVVPPITILVLALMMTVRAIAARATVLTTALITDRCYNPLDGSGCFERCPKSAVRVRRAYGEKPQSARYRRETDGCPNGHLIFPCSTVPSPRLHAV